MHHEGDNMMSVKRTNRSAALLLLHRQGGMPRKRLAECTGLTPAAITKIVGEMIEEGLVREGEPVLAGGAGRREILLKLNPEAVCALGMLLNLHTANLSALWLDGTVIFSEDVPIETPANAPALVESLSNRLMQLAEQHHIDSEKILGVGVAVRGITSLDEQSVSNSFGVFKERDYPIVAEIKRLTGYDAVLSNNVRALFAAQMFKSTEEDFSSQFFLRCEFGIGASLLIHDKIWLGGTGQCSEIGHIPVVRRGGRQCACGKSGCLETIASANAIRNDALELMTEGKAPVLQNMCKGKTAEEIDINDVVEAARNGDEHIGQVLDRAVSALANALKSVIYVIDPEKIVLYGQLFDNPYYLSKLMMELKEGVDKGHKTIIEKSPFNLSLESCAAGLLMIQEFFRCGGMMQS